MNLYYIQEGYIDFLRRYDNKVAENKATIISCRDIFSARYYYIVN